MRIDENWAVAESRICEFFRSQSDVSMSGNDFLYGGCRITVTPLPGTQTGMFACPRTQVRMEGNEEDVNLIHRRFFLRFLSAGG